MTKIGLFVLFFIAYVCWALLGAKSFKKLQADLLGGKSFWSSEVILLEGLVGLFGFIYLLSGLWSTKLVLLIFVASHLGILLSLIFGAMLGPHSEKAAIRMLWAGREIAIKHPVSMGLLGLATMGMSFAYPIVVGIFFFRNPWGSLNLEIEVVRYSLLLLSLGGYLLVVVVTACMLASENLDDNTRQRIFINQLCGLIPAAIYVALAIWAFGFGGGLLSLDFLGIPSRTLSLQTLFMLLGFFALGVLIPYVVGTQRSRSLNVELMAKINAFVAELAEILESPTPSLYIAKLTALRDKVAATKDQFINGDALLLFEKGVLESQEKLSEDDQTSADAIAKTRDLDARFRFLDDLSRFETELDEIIADLKNRPEATIEAAADQWSKKYEIRKAELAKKIEGATSGKPLVTAGVGTLVTTIVSGLLSEVARTSWQWIMQAHK